MYDISLRLGEADLRLCEFDLSKCNSNLKKCQLESGMFYKLHRALKKMHIIIISGPRLQICVSFSCKLSRDDASTVLAVPNLQ